MRTELDPLGALPEPEPQPRRWALVHHASPPTENQVRTWHFRRRAAMTAEWRHAFMVLAKEAGIPRLERCRVEVTHYVHRRGNWPDAAACLPAAKAALDGVRDAGVVEDDDPFHVLSVEFQVRLAPAAWKRPGITGALGLVVIEEGEG